MSLTRRSFLSTALLAAVATRVRAAGAPPFPFFAMDTAIRSLANLDIAKSLGYAGVGWKPGPPEAMQDALKRVQERGLKLFAIYAGAVLTKSALTWSPEVEADLAVLRGSAAMVWLPINSKEFTSSAAEGDEIAVPALQRLADLAAAQDLRVAIYPHKGSWTERVQDAVRVAQKVNRPNLGATFNLCHCLSVGDEAHIPELLEQAAPHLFLVTVNGADSEAANGGWGRLIRPLDEGTFDLHPLLAKLTALNYRGPIGLQGFGLKIPVEESLRRSIEAWKTLG